MSVVAENVHSVHSDARVHMRYDPAMARDTYLNVFAGNPLDRAGDRRGDAAWIARRLAEPTTWVLALRDGDLLVEDGPNGPRLAYLAPDLARTGDPQRRLFLGLHGDDAVFAVDVAPAAPAPSTMPTRFEGLRGLAGVLSAAELGMAATAKAVFAWSRRHPHCSVCGAATQVSDAGWRRLCPGCGAEHFPRTDPVVIMLPVRGERCLMGRQTRFPPGMHSALAGFLEPGESIEEACAREVKEEAALTVSRATYHSSQPWPWPSSLMIGLIAEVAEGEAVADLTELEAVRWFTRDEAARMVGGEAVDGCTAPPPLAIAHHLLKAWSQGFGASS